MKLKNKIQLIYYLLLINIQGCSQIRNNNVKIDTYDQFRTQQIDLRDSLFILYTVREWGKKMWYTWAVRTDLYKIKNEDVVYFIGGTFYSPDKKKIVVWVGKKMPNAQEINLPDTYIEKYRICPTGADTIYSMSALIGIRDSINQTWKLYPFEQEGAGCFDRKEKVINILGQYYFEKMKQHQMYRMMQSGERKGYQELQEYGYNIQNADFWTMCWLWQKDTVGSYGLYPFQILGYNYNGDKCSQKCADPYNLPKIIYPLEILKLFK